MQGLWPPTELAYARIDTMTMTTTSTFEYYAYTSESL
jgi:hypothetical protein